MQLFFYLFTVGAVNVLALHRDAILNKDNMSIYWFQGLTGGKIVSVQAAVAEIEPMLFEIVHNSSVHIVLRLVL